MRKEEIQRERERSGRAGERAPESDERRKERGNESDREKIERLIDAGNSKIYELPLHIIQTCKRSNTTADSAQRRVADHVLCALWQGCRIFDPAQRQKTCPAWRMLASCRCGSFFGAYA